MSKAQAEGPEPDQTRRGASSKRLKAKGRACLVSTRSSLQTYFLSFWTLRERGKKPFFLISIITKGRKQLKTPDPALSESCH
jgi:hypothetical protein